MLVIFFFFFNDTATTEIYTYWHTLSLHDALPILFRAALARPHDVALGEELALVRRYLEIEAVRFGPRLRVAWRLPEPLPEVAVPALSVQALVENAVRHGIERSPGGGGIDIAVDVVGDEGVVEVRNELPPGRDDGGGGGHSIGLQATQIGRAHV